jgi:predicted membrane-bound spermidine synthase
MSAAPVAVLLLFNVLVLIAGYFVFDKANRHGDSVLFSLLFLCSGMPALIYQIVWQRVLFSIYGVNSQSVAVVVTAFMLGLGIGSLAGGRLSARFPRRAILIFGIAELGVAAFGLCSLRIFQWAATHTAGANLPAVILFSLLLLLFPTILMGATLPLLVEHLVLHTNRVGPSVSTLYFANTFGSAIACYLCATFLLRDFGQSGSMSIAACLNAVVGGAAYLYSRREKQERVETTGAISPPERESTPVPLPVAMLLAGASGFIALGFEIAWFRVFAIASSDRAPAFALLLSTYLAGIAAGCYLSEKGTGQRKPETVMRVVGILLILAGAISAYLPPLVATFLFRKIPFLASAPIFFVTAALIGSILPLLCRVAIPPDANAGRSVSFVYVSNIIGSALGSLGIGFFLMQHLGLRSVSLGLGMLAVLLGSAVLIFNKGRTGMPPVWALALIAGSFVAVPVSSGLYSLLFERLIFGNRAEARVSFAHVVENRNGVIGVTQDRAVFGGGVYDGYFNVDPIHDSNLVVRAYALSAFCPAPRRILVIGLASGSWGQILANHPQVETLDAVEINPGYLQLIPQYPMVQSFLKNPKVHVYADDGRRWLLAHPEARYDAIVTNTSYNWRDHSSVLLSADFFQLARAHLNPGGIYYFNTTEADETIATALHVFPYGLRIINFVAVSDSSMAVDKDRWMSILRRYTIDGKTMFDPLDPAAQKMLAGYMALADTLKGPPRFLGLESSDSLRLRTAKRLIITDDNMGLEWSSNFTVPWH